MQVRWHGHSFFTVVTRDGTILAIDPFFAAAPPAALDIRPDLVLVTHAHSDHAEDAPRLRAPILATHEVANELGRRGSAATGMGIGGSWRDGALRVWCTPAWHSSDFDWPEGAPVVPGGHPCGFVVDDGETRFYHAGDTGLFGDMRTVIRDVLRPHAAALPIGDRYTMGPEHAARGRMARRRCCDPDALRHLPGHRAGPERIRAPRRQERARRDPAARTRRGAARRRGRRGAVSIRGKARARARGWSGRGPERGTYLVTLPLARL